MGAYNEMDGKVFGKLTVVGYIKGNRKNKIRAQRICECACGNTVNKTDKYLLRNKNPSCGCLLLLNTKVCSACRIEKDKSEYHKLTTKKIGVQVLCKECTSKKRKEIYWNNRDEMLKKNEIIRNKPSNIIKSKNYYQENKDKYKERYLKYMQDDKKKMQKEKTRLKYKEKNGDKIKMQKKEYHSRQEVKERLKKTHLKRKKTDIQYNIKRRLRFRLRNIINRLGNKDLKYKSAIELLGCDVKFFKSYIEYKFTGGMCWERISEIHIDHIIPCSKFDLTNLEQQKICFHYSNLQPLWWIDNLIKGSKVIQ